MKLVMMVCLIMVGIITIGVLVSVWTEVIGTNAYTNISGGVATWETGLFKLLPLAALPLLVFAGYKIMKVKNEGDDE